jgi:hypothetical protein
LVFDNSRQKEIKPVAMEQPELLAEDIRKFATNVLAQPKQENSLESVLELQAVFC